MLLNTIKHLQLQQNQGFYFFVASVLIMKITVDLTCKKPSVSTDVGVGKKMCFLSNLDTI